MRSTQRGNPPSRKSKTSTRSQSPPFSACIINHDCDPVATWHPLGNESDIDGARHPQGHRKGRRDLYRVRWLSGGIWRRKERRQRILSHDRQDMRVPSLRARVGSGRRERDRANRGRGRGGYNDVEKIYPQ